MTQLGGEIPPVPKKGVDEVEQIVPVIRSADNMWWVACLSGTFEGPYYAFPNTFGIPAEALDDNIEIDLDGQLISIGENPIEDSINNPELYFIAQTGVRPEYEDLDYSDPEQSSETATVAWSSNPGIYKSVSEEGNYAMVGIAIGSLPSSTQGSSADITLWGMEFSPAYSDTVFDSGGTCVDHAPWQANNSEVVFTSDPAPPSDEELRTQVRDKFSANYTAQAGATPPFVDWHVEYYNNTDTTTVIENSLFEREVSIRAEREDISRSCSAYRKSEIITTDTRSQTYPYPKIGEASIGMRLDAPTYSSSVETEYSDCFKVDDTEFVLAGPKSSEYPEYVHSYDCMKYYNTDSMAAITGMMSAALREAGGEYSWFNYHYVGPNSQDGLVVTQFGTNSGDYEHIIPNVEGIDDTVIFYGEIFLGLIKYEIEV